MDDDGEYTMPKGERENLWIILAAFLNMIAGIFHEINSFFTCAAMTASSRYLWDVNRQRFFEQASKDIEEITNAPTEQPGYGVGSWTAGTAD